MKDTKGYVYVIVFLILLGGAALTQNITALASTTTISSNYTLTENETISGDLNLSGGTIDLNGYTLNIQGDLTQGNGHITVKNGHLYVFGNYTVTNSHGTLTMDHTDGVVIVGGDFTYQGRRSTLSAGRIEIGGDFKQIRNTQSSAQSNNFQPSGTHRVILKGNSVQTVDFSHPSSGNSYFWELEIDNEAGVEALTLAYVRSRMVFKSTDITGDFTLTGDATVDGNTWYGNLRLVESYAFQHNMIITGNLHLNANLSTNAFNISGHSVHVEGSIQQHSGNLMIGSGTLTVQGNYSASNTHGFLTMNHEDGYFLIHGDFTYQGRQSTLSAGLLEIKGDFKQLRNTQSSTQSNNFQPSGTHRVKLSGDAFQTVDFQNPSSGNSHFWELEIDNDSGVEALTLAHVRSQMIFTTTNISGDFTLTGDATVDGNTWYGDLRLVESYAFQHNMIITGNLHLNAGLASYVFNISGHSVLVEGSIQQDTGNLSIGNGMLTVEGDYNVSNTYSYLTMNHEDGHFLIHGDFTYRGRQSTLSAGLLEIHGNFTQRRNHMIGESSHPINFRPSGTHRVKLSGDALQTVHFDDPSSSNSYFWELEIDNDAGVEALTLAYVLSQMIFTTTNVTGDFTLAGTPTVDGNIWYGDLRLVHHYALQQNLKVTGNLTMGSGGMDTNGHTLTIEGHLFHNAGILTIGSGTVLLEGNYTLPPSDGRLSMVHEDGYFLVEGSFYYRGQVAYLSAGLLEIKGDFTQLRGNRSHDPSNNFSPSGTHRVKLSGDTKQTIRFGSPGATISRFWMLEIDNEAGVEALSRAFVLHKMIFTTTHITGDLSLVDEATVEGGIWYGDLSLFAEFQFQHDLIVTGDFRLHFGYTTGITDLNGKTLTVEGNIIHTSGVLVVGSGTVLLEGNYTVSSASGRLNMEDEAGYFLVDGNFHYQGHVANLSAGLLEIKGNFTQRRSSSVYPANNFSPTGTHRVKLSGDTLQTVDFGRAGSTVSRFWILEIDNEAGVESLTRAFVVYQMIFTTTTISGDFTLADTAMVEGHTWYGDLTLFEPYELSHDLNVNGNFILQFGSTNHVMDVSGHTLTIEGNLNHNSGNLVIGSGTIVLEGHYTVSSASGRLNMEDEAGYFLVQGHFYYRGEVANLSAGLLEIKGNFTQIRGIYNYNPTNNFRPSGSHRVKLSGDELQTVQFGNPSGTLSNFWILEIDNEAGIEASSRVFVRHQMIFSTTSISGDFSLTGSATVKHGIWHGDLIIFESFTLQEDLVVKGNLTISATTNHVIDINGHILTIEDNFTHQTGILALHSGTVLLDGDYTANTSASILKMVHEDDYFLIGGNFYYQGGVADLSSGLLEIKGNFTQRRGIYSHDPTNNFRPVGTHKTKLSGDALQTIDFGNPGTSISRFWILEIDNEAGVNAITRAYVASNIIFTTTAITGHLTLSTGATVESGTWYGDLTLFEAYECQHNLTVSGNLTLDSALLSNDVSLQENTLTLNGNLIHNGGRLHIDDGTLVVKGNYHAQNSFYPVLIMEDADGHMHVKGDFIYEGRIAILVAGTLEIEGHFTQRRNSNHNQSNNFGPSGTHRVKLSGQNHQTIDFQNPSSANSYFWELEINNAAGVEALTRVFILSKMIFGSTAIEGDFTLGVNATVEENTWYGDLTLYEGHTLQGHLSVQGDLHLHGAMMNQALDLSEHTLQVSGNIYHDGGQLKIDAGTLVLEGDYTASSSYYPNLNMEHEEGHFFIHGHFYYQGRKGALSAGLLEVRGNFTQRRSIVANIGNQSFNFSPSGTHRTKLSGHALQTVDFENPSAANSYFWEFEVANSHEIEFITRAFVLGNMIFTTHAISNPEHLHPAENATVQNGAWLIDLYIHSAWTLEHDVIVYGEISGLDHVVYNGYSIKRAFTLTYHMNQATIGDVPIDDKSPYVEESTVIVSGNQGYLEKTGYAFNGWNTHLDGSGNHFQEDDEFVILENTVLYAQWLKIHSVIFMNYDDTVLKTEEVIHGHPATPPEAPTRTGYTFIGWDKAFNDITDNLTVTAFYEINSYTVIFKDHDGTILKTEFVDYGHAATPPEAPTRIGYTFIEWDTPYALIEDDLFVTAIYEINSYTVTFKGQDETVIETHTMTYQEQLVDLLLPSAPHVIGHTFTGWSEQLPLTMPAHDVIITAVYTINAYTMTFDSVGGTTLTPVTNNYQAYIQAPEDPEKTGHTFGGWYLDNTYLTPFEFSIMPAQHLTLYAKWIINQYTLTFDTTGGSHIDVITLNYAENITPPDAPTKQGYTFNGWRPLLPDVMPAENLHIQATWSKEYTQSEDIDLHVSGIRDAIDEALIQNRDVDIIISIQLTHQNDLNQEDIEQILQIANLHVESNRKQIIYLDITLLIKESGLETQVVSNLNQMVTITIIIPENHRGYFNYGIIRVHDGIAELLDVVYDADHHTLTFQTDRFSNYAIVYEMPGPAFSAWWFITLTAIPMGFLGYKYRKPLIEGAKQLLKKR